MNLLSYDEIMRIIESNVEEVTEFAFMDDHDSRAVLESKLGKIAKVEEVGGGEGDGEEFYVVYHFEAHDVYIRVEGVYSSYEGVSFYNEWDNCKQVTPQSKTITVYE